MYKEGVSSSCISGRKLLFISGVKSFFSPDFGQRGPQFRKIPPRPHSIRPSHFRFLGLSDSPSSWSFRKIPLTVFLPVRPILSLRLSPLTSSRMTLPFLESRLKPTVPFLRLQKVLPHATDLQAKSPAGVRHRNTRSCLTELVLSVGRSRGVEV